MTTFEEQYISARRRENRLYSDEQVKWLPEIAAGHPHFNEWQSRRDSCDRLTQYLLNKRKELDILEVGCGNGWLCHQLSRIPGSNVAGIDVNKIELEQAKRVFHDVENLEFLDCEINDATITNEKFDAVIFASSIQYFPSVNDVIATALALLNPGGEVHIVDSFLYKASEVETARKRSADYYESLQLSEMSSHYFHHSIEELSSFNYKILYRPDTFLNRFMKHKSPFPWICIRNHA